MGSRVNSLSFLPDALREAMRRRVRELAGLGLIFVATLLGLALATWSVQDPSLSHATNNRLHNVLGFPGAIVADLLMQLFGVAALALIVPIAIWGWRLATHRALNRERVRMALWLVGILLAAGCAAFLPHSAAWPLPVGLGGVIGDWMLRLPVFIAGGTLSGLTSAAAALGIGVAALLCFAVVAGFGWHGGEPATKEREEEDERGASISLGWIA